MQHCCTFVSEATGHSCGTRGTMPSGPALPVPARAPGDLGRGGGRRHRGGAAHPKGQNIFSFVTGKARTRLPVAW